MKDRIIAFTVCSVIFIVVLIIGVITATRGSSRAINNNKQISTAATQQVAGEIQDTAPQLPVNEPPPQPKSKFKILRPEKIYGQFDTSQAKQLTGVLAQYQFKSGILLDMGSNKVLWQKNASTPVPIASLTKLLTIYTAFEEMERRQDIDLNTLVTVSRECTLAAPVKINLQPGEKVRLHELFIYSMLKSANDASHLIAEYFGYGDSADFIRLMNQTAADIGMSSSSFVNANGLPIYGKTPNDVSMNMASCIDMVKLIERIYDYPMILRYTSCRQNNTKRGTLTNGNRLLGVVPGMEGLKTGYTNAAGHCLAFSCRRNGRRLVGVVTGFSKRQNCFDFTKRLLDWGFAH